MIGLFLTACGGGGKVSGSSNTNGNNGSNSSSGSTSSSGSSSSSSYTLTVTKSSAIGGTITSTPAGISCDTTCTTQSASFTGSVSLSVTNNSAFGAVFTGWSGGACSGVKTCSITLSADTSVDASFVALSDGQLALFGTSSGGGGTDFTGVYDGSGDPIDVSSSDNYFSEVIPSTQDLVELDEFTSESYSSWLMVTFEQDHQAFEVLYSVPLPSSCTIKSEFYSGTSIISSHEIDLSDNDGGINSINGWEPNHFGIVNGNLYYQQPIEWDDFKLAYDIGGELKMKPASGGSTVTLLERTDPDNGAAMDAADNGTLYAIYYDSKTGILTVWTRDLTTGKLATQLRGYTATDLTDLSFRINNGYLYGTYISTTDGSTQVWSTDLSIPMASQTAPVILATYPSTLGKISIDSGGVLNNWGVDNGHVVFSFTPPKGSSYSTTVADLDTSTGNTEYYDFTSFNLYNFTPIWQSAASTSSAQFKNKRERPVVASFGESKEIMPMN